jgi:hypothetical protein
MAIDQTTGAALFDGLTNLGGYGLMGAVIVWFIKREFTSLKSRIDCFEKAQHACQISNAKEFATKADVKSLWERVDEHAEDIALIKGKMEVK